MCFGGGGWTPPWARLKGDAATLSFDQRPEAEIVSHFSSTVISCSTTRRLSGCLSLCPSRAAIWPPPRRRGCERLCGANDPILLVEAGRCDVDRRVKWGAMRHLPDSPIGQPQFNSLSVTLTIVALILMPPAISIGISEPASTGLGECPGIVGTSSRRIEVPTLPIRLLPTPTTCRVLPRDRPSCRRSCTADMPGVRLDTR